ncbi:MAG: hypothetical protein ACRDK3_02360 [Actinomycetota bacterium]
MRIPGNRLVAVVVLASAALPACGSGEGEQALASAREQTREALARLERLEGRIDELESELGDARVSNDGVSARLDDLARKLKKSTARLEGSLGEAEGSATSAGGRAEEALGVAGEAARDISILTNRLNYHLRDHGGG